MKVLKSKKGFTLVELIVVIAIIGILAAVLIPSITGYITKAKESAAMQEANALKVSYESWLVERSLPDYPSDLKGPVKEKDFLLYLEYNKLINFNETTAMAPIIFEQSSPFDNNDYLEFKDKYPDAIITEITDFPSIEPAYALDYTKGFYFKASNGILIKATNVNNKLSFEKIEEIDLKLFDKFILVDAEDQKEVINYMMEP